MSTIRRDSNGRVVIPPKTHREALLKWANKLFAYLKELSRAKGYNEKVIEEFTAYDSIIGMVYIMKEKWMADQHKVIMETLAKYQFDSKDFTDEEIENIRKLCGVIYSYTIEQIFPLMKDPKRVAQIQKAAEEAEKRGQQMTKGLEERPILTPKKDAMERLKRDPEADSAATEARKKRRVVNWCKDCQGEMVTLPTGELLCQRCVRKQHNSKRKSASEEECKCQTCKYDSTDTHSLPEPIST